MVRRGLFGKIHGHLTVRPRANTIFYIFLRFFVLPCVIYNLKTYDGKKTFFSQTILNKSQKDEILPILP